MVLAHLIRRLQNKLSHNPDSSSEKVNMAKLLFVTLRRIFVRHGPYCHGILIVFLRVNKNDGVFKKNEKSVSDLWLKNILNK